MKHRYNKQQQLYCNIETAWEFFSSPLNLEKITPKDLGFRVLSKIKNQEIYEGMIIDYIVSPIMHIPLKWKTEITQLEKLKSFTDFQLEGPYEYWNHYHEFIPNSHGVLMRDTVDYELPWGLLGNIALRLFVKKKLDYIFNFRHQVLEEKFSKI